MNQGQIQAAHWKQVATQQQQQIEAMKAALNEKSQIDRLIVAAIGGFCSHQTAALSTPFTENSETTESKQERYENGQEWAARKAIATVEHLMREFQKAAELAAQEEQEENSNQQELPLEEPKSNIEVVQ